jgi:hypothetical protein
MFLLLKTTGITSLRVEIDEMVLSLQDLWGVVDGMDEMPDATTDPKGFAEWKSRDLSKRERKSLWPLKASH